MSETEFVKEFNVVKAQAEMAEAQGPEAREFEDFVREVDKKGEVPTLVAGDVPNVDLEPGQAILPIAQEGGEGAPLVLMQTRADGLMDESFGPGITVDMEIRKPDGGLSIFRFQNGILMDIQDG